MSGVAPADERARGFAALLVLAMSVMITGCVTSSRPYFDASTAVLPFSEGRYDAVENHGGLWVNTKSGNLTRSGATYMWKSDGSTDELRMTVHPVAQDNFIVSAREYKDDQLSEKYQYFLLRKVAEGFVLYDPNCLDLTRLRAMPPPLRPRMTKNDCAFTGQQHVIHALGTFAGASAPALRFVPGKRQE